MKAELARELGQFMEALKLLEYSFKKNYLLTVNRIKELATKHEPRVAEMTA